MTRSWKAGGVIPSFPVLDLTEAVAFYERLGFEQRWSYPEQAPDHAGLALDDVSIMLFTNRGVEGEGDLEWGPRSLYVLVHDVDAFHAHLASTLGPPLGAPEDTDYGMRDFEVSDPSGNRLTFGEALERVAERDG